MKAGLLGCHAVVLAATLIGNAAAQTEARTATVYRCGADGRELRDSPCPNSQNSPKVSGSQVEFDQPSAAQSRAASARAIEDAKRARALEEKRNQAEAQARRHASHAVGINGLAVPAAAAAKPASAPKQPVPPKAPKLTKPHRPAVSSEGSASAAR